MTQREVTLMEVLDNREQRVARQRRLLREYGGSLICFTMNIPGPVKNNLWIRGGYRLGKGLLLDLLKSAGIPVLHQEEVCAVTGCEGFFCVDAPAEKVKALTVRLEDSREVGRLFDMDVLSADGSKRSREELGMAGRTCLICGRPASVCGPVRAHSAAELWQRAQQLLRQAVAGDVSRRIGALAGKALLYEVCTTPKPGLVDRENSGAHEDMDIYTFLGSSARLQSYFARCAEAGILTREEAPEETFRQIRLAGMLAEQEMFRETGGINTHKGAVFSMGIACAAAGRLFGCGEYGADELMKECGRIAEGVARQDFDGVTVDNAKTVGERLFAAYGITGIRGQAEAGFPAVLYRGLPVLRKGLEMGLSPDRAGAAALLAMLADTDDTNLIARSDRETQLRVRREVAALLEEEPYPEEEILRALDRDFTRQRLSPGGSADLLALCWFTHFVQGEPELFWQ